MIPVSGKAGVRSGLVPRIRGRLLVKLMGNSTFFALSFCLLRHKVYNVLRLLKKHPV